MVNDCFYDIPQALLRMLFSLPSKAFSNRWHAFSHQGLKSTQPCTPSPHSLSGCCHFSCPVLCTLPPSHTLLPGNLSWDFCLDLNHTPKGPSSTNLSGSPQPLVSPLPLKLLIVSYIFIYWPGYGFIINSSSPSLRVHGEAPGFLSNGEVLCVNWAE